MWDVDDIDMLAVIAELEERGINPQVIDELQERTDAEDGFLSAVLSAIDAADNAAMP